MTSPAVNCWFIVGSAISQVKPNTYPNQPRRNPLKMTPKAKAMAKNTMLRK